MNLHNLLRGVADNYGLGGLFNKVFPGSGQPDPNADPNAPQGPDNYLLNGATPGGPGTVAPPMQAMGQAPYQPNYQPQQNATPPQAPQAPGGGVTATPDQEIQVTGQHPAAPVVAAQPDGTMEGRGTLTRGLPAGPQAAAQNKVNLSNDAYVVAAQQARDSAANATDADGNPVHHGMFGIHGKMRDLLGLFGDTVNSTNGRADVYAPEQMRERLGDAMAGSTEHPQEAIERLNSQGFTDQAKAIGDSADTRDLRDATMANTQAYHASLVADHRSKLLMAVGTTVGQTLNGTTDGPSRDAALSQIFARLKAMKIDPEELGLKLGMTGDEAQAAVNASITTNQQRQLPIAQQNADAHTTSANKQPAARAPANPTDTTLSKHLIDIVEGGGTLTPGQQKAANMLGHGDQRGKGRAKVVLPPLDFNSFNR